MNVTVAHRALDLVERLVVLAERLTDESIGRESPEVAGRRQAERRHAHLPEPEPEDLEIGSKY